MLTFIDNNDWKQTPPPKAGDSVHLRSRDSWGYTVRVLVHSIEGDTIKGQIEVIFDKDLKTNVTGGNVMEDIGKRIEFPRTKVFQVLSGKPL